MPALQSLVCDDNPCSSICEPANYAALNGFYKAQAELGIFSTGGSRASGQTTTACDFFGASSGECAYFTKYESLTYEGDSITEVGLGQVEALGRRALTGKFINATSTFAEDGFCTEQPEIDLSKVKNKVSADFFQNELYCSPAVQKKILQDGIENLQSVLTWQKGRDTSRSPGDNDATWVNIAISQMGSAEAADLDCSTLVFPWTE